MVKTSQADWFFIIPATIVWLAALAVTGWDFSFRRRRTFRLGWLPLVGMALMVSGVGLRMLARRALGRHFSYLLRTIAEHRLVTHGVYRYVRHPAYTGDLLFQFGIPIFFSSGYGLLVMFLLVPLLLYRIRIEEEMLVRQFGAAYLEYRSRSKQLVPLIY